MRRAAAEVNSLAGWPPCAQARSLLDEDVKDAERLSRERGNLPPYRDHYTDWQSDPHHRAKLSDACAIALRVRRQRLVSGVMC